MGLSVSWFEPCATKGVNRAIPKARTVTDVQSLGREKTAPSLEGETARSLPSRIFLVGFMGAGKTSIGRVLAGDLGYADLDLDREIEFTARASVRQIFEQQGEAAFRDLEHQCLRETLAKDQVVVSTGGGTMTFERNRALMTQGGMSVFLHPSFETIAARLTAHGRRTRPLFEDTAQARRLFEQRLPDYRLADLEIPVASGETAVEVAARIRFLL